MIEFEELISRHLVEQIYKVLSKVCNSACDVPEYKIVFNFEIRDDMSQYIFDGVQYKGARKGSKFTWDEPCVNQIDENNVVQVCDVFEKYQLIIYFSFDDAKLSIIFDISSKPYVNVFFDYLIKAYFFSKEVYLQKLLSKLINGRDTGIISSLEIYKIILNDLTCWAEEELIISRAVSEFFFHCYQTDINFITFLSCQTYEGKVASGNIYLSRRASGRGKRHAQLIIKFLDSIDFKIENVRKIRKLVEVAKFPLNLVVGREKKIIGYTDELPRKYEGKISILGNLYWKFELSDYELVYNEGVYRLFSEKQKESNKSNGLVKCFSQKQNERINKIILQAEEQAHGTILIFGNTKDIKNEAKRLANYGRGIIIAPINMINKKLIVPNIAAIDGAIMLDYEGICYAIGVILDGDTVAKGKTERGARYNSAINYVERQKILGRKFLAVVISEDRTVDLYPDQK